MATEDPAKRLAAYGDLLKIVGEEVPYVALYLEEINLALSSEFAWPQFHAYAVYEPWALQVEPR
jgi:ABC-type transport system substrate-binding protein